MFMMCYSNFGDAMSNESEERLRKAQKYVEMLIDSKLEDWRVTRDDLRAIMERLDYVKTISDSLIETLSNITKEQSLTRSILERLSTKLEEKSQLTISDLKTSLEDISNVCKELREMSLKVYNYEMKVSKKLESLSSTIKTLKEENKELLTSLRKDISGLRTELSNISKNLVMILQKQQDIDKSLSEFNTKITSVDTDKLANKLSRKIDGLKTSLIDKISEISEIKASVGKLGAQTFELGPRLTAIVEKQEEVLRGIELMNRNQEALIKVLNEVSNLVRGISRGLAMLSNIRDRMEALISGIEHISARIGATKEKTGTVTERR